MKKPNIFKYATSELSQDAFIAWLLEWANKENKLQDEQLHLLGLEFLISLLVKENTLIGEISNVEIKTQFQKIDVFVSFTMFNRKYGIIIEDKVHTSNHSGQLTKYKSFIESKNFDIVIPIYFKTGFQHCFKDVVSKGYYPYTTKEFSQILQKGKFAGIDNAVFLNYLEYLKEIEEKYDDAKFTFDNYKEVVVSDWHWWSCVGFFNDYQEHFNAGWSSVANNREPLLAFWFGGRPFKIKNEQNISLNLELYIDIQFSHSGLKVSYRLGLNNNQQTNSFVRNKVFDALYPYLQRKNINCRRAKFMKAKETIKLAEIISSDKSIKHEGFVKQLELYKEVLNEFTSNYKD